MIKAIILDIDGTLTNDRKEITPRTREALLKAQDGGVLLALASGRPDMGLVKWAKELHMNEHHGLFLCYNGAKVMDCQTGEVLFSKSLTKEEAKDVLEHLKQFEVTPIIARGEYMHTTDVYGCTFDYKGAPLNIVEYESRGNNYLLCEHKDLAAWVDFPVEKILTAASPAYLQENHEAMAAPFKDRLSCMFTADYYFEYTAKGVNKATAMEVAFGKLGISRDEMIAFGDAENDLTMLEYAGTGVAMANASEDVKAVADEITLDNNHDGIAAALEQHGIL
ncbi:MAG: HAD family phosphatase [Clostridia bacterium]|nr:HAD family phosphatase [Clostridia bacterium]MBQ8926588.1 HAD family phosphatase [Clostridia bacterium]